MPQCTAKAKSTGNQCKRSAVSNYPVCQVHGAGSPLQGRPGGRPRQSGRWSTKLPNRLKSRYIEFLNDPQLLDMDSEIALVDTRLGEIVELLVIEGGDKITWELLNDYFQDAKSALEGGKTAKFEKLFEKVGNVIFRGNSEWLLWNEISGLVEMRRKLVESQRKYMIEQSYMISLEDLEISRNAFANLVMEFIDTPEKRTEFVTRYRAIGDETEMRRLANAKMKLIKQ